MLAIVLGICLTGHVLAQETRLPIEPADTSSPRATLNSFIEACNALYGVVTTQPFRTWDRPENVAHYNRLVDCMDTSDVPGFEFQNMVSEAALSLKEVIDRLALPNDEDIPGPDDLLGPDGETLLQTWRLPGTEITLERVKEGPKLGHYVFSVDTVDRARSYYEAMADRPYRATPPAVSPDFFKWYFTEPRSPGMKRIVRWLPPIAKRTLLGYELWQWVGLFASIVLGLGLMAVVYARGKTLSAHVREENELFRYWLTLIFPITAMLVPLGFVWVMKHSLVIRGTALYVSDFASNLIFLSACIVLVLGLGRRMAETIIASPKINPASVDAQFIRILFQIGSIVASMFVFIEGAKALGFPVTTILASAGVGGLAVALAAQDTLKNLFATMSIMVAKPYRVGERIKVLEHDGIVEEIGLRSTRLRGFISGHLVSIPNDKVAQCNIENIGRRHRITKRFEIHIPLDTPRANLLKALELTEAAVADHPGMDPEWTPKVFLSDIVSDGFQIQVTYWVHEKNYWEAQACHDHINRALVDGFSQAGIGFSLPFLLGGRVKVNAEGEATESFDSGRTS